MRFLSRRRPGLTQVVRPARERSLDALRRAVSHVEGLEDRVLFAAQLEVEKTVLLPAGGNVVDAGSNITYQIIVRNTGDTVASNVQITDTYSTASEQDRARFVSATRISGNSTANPTPPANNLAPVVVNIGDLGAATSYTFNVVLNVEAGAAQGTVVTNTATATTPSPENPTLGDLPGDPPGKADNTSTTQITVTPRADLQVNKALQPVVGAPAPLLLPDAVVAGVDATYTITLRNNGPSIARNVVLSDVVPQFTTFISFRQVSGPTFNVPASAGTPLPPVGQGGTATAQIAALAPNTEAVFELRLNVNSNAPDDKQVTNVAEAKTDTKDLFPANNISVRTNEIEIQTDLLIVSAIDSPTPVIEGQFFPYTMTVLNRGPSDAQNVGWTWDTPNLGVTNGELGFWYPTPNVTQGGPPVDQIAGPAFNLTIPGDPPQPRGTFTGAIQTLGAGAGATFQFYVGTAQQQKDVEQNSEITSASPDYNAANNTFTAIDDVGDAPLVVDAVPNFTADAGQPANPVLMEFRDTNQWPGTPPRGYAPNYTTPSGRFIEAPDFNATVEWGDGTTTAGVIDVNPLTGVYVVRGTHVYQAAGLYSVRISVTGDGSSTAIGDSVVTVGEAPRGVGAVGGLQFTENVSETKRVGVFSRGNAPTSTSFTAIINWGDGTPATAGVLRPNGQNAFDIIGTHNYVDEGTYTGSIVVTGSDGGTNSSPMVVVVADRAVVATPVDVAAQTNLPTTHTVATFTDPGGPKPANQYIVQIDWGDGTELSAGFVTFDQQTGVYTVQGTHTFPAPGNFVMTVTITHGTAPSTAVRPNATVANSPVNPQVQGTAVNVTASRGVPRTGVVVATFTDPGPDDAATAYQALIDWGDNTPATQGTVTYNAATQIYTVTGDHTYDVVGTFNMTVTIRHLNSPSEVVTPIATVSNPQALSAQKVDVSAAAGFAVTNVPVATFTDPSGVGPVADYAATIDWGDGTAADAGTITLNPNTGVYTVTGTHTFATPGTFSMVVTITKAGLAPAIVQPVATVSNAVPLNAQPVNVSAARTVPLNNVVVATFTDPGPDGPVGSYQAVIDWGDNTPSSTGTITYNNSTQTYTVTGSHTYDVAGSFTMTVTLRKAGLPDAVVQPVATVVANRALPAQGRNISVQAGAAFTNVAVATFTDPGLDEPLANYTATINWGDTTAPSPGTITYNVQTGVYTVTGGHTYFAAATYDATVTISKANTQDAVVPFTAVASANAGLPVSGVNVSAARGVPANNVTVATFTDPGPLSPVSSYSATIDWGDNTPQSPGTITYNASTETYTVTGSHTYTTLGDYTMTVTVRKAGLPDSVVRPTATVVSRAGLAAQPVNVTAQQGVAVTDVPVATFADASGAGSVAPYTAVIDWGDGTAPSPGTITFDAATSRYTVVGTHTFAATGTFNMTVTIRKANTQDTIVTPVATVGTVGPAGDIVAGEPTTFTAVEGRPKGNVIVGRFTARNAAATAADFTATINWGDGTSSAGTIAAIPPAAGGGGGGGAPAPANQFNVVGSHTYANDGRYNVTVVVRTVANPGAGFTITPATRVAVTDAALSGVSRLFTAPRNGTFNGLVAQVIDGNPLDTNGGEYQATIRWGDGTPTSTGTVAYNASLQRFEVRGSHTYTRASPPEGFEVTVFVRDGLASTTITSFARVL